MTTDYNVIASKLDARLASDWADDARMVERVWTAPREIKGDLPPAPAFESDVLLPQALADFVLDEADRMPCPPDYIATALMVALGSVIGASCALKPKSRDDWLVTPNLYGGVVGEPSAKKSPALSVVMRFMDQLEKTAAQKFEREMTSYEAEVTAYELRRAAIKAEMKGSAKRDNSPEMAAAVEAMKSLTAPVEPQPRRFKVNDATIEKIGEILTSNPNGILVCRDELMGLLASWERSGREEDRSFYLEGWNGTALLSVGRITRGDRLIENHCLSVFGGIQPDLLERYLTSISNSMDNDGRMQRFQMMTYPEPVPWEWKDRTPMEGVREEVQGIFTRLAALDPTNVGARPADAFSKLPFFRFSDEAQELFIEWSRDLNLVQIPDEQNSMMKQHLGKFEKLFCAIALILHLVEGGGERVSAANVRRAAAWCEYLSGHARRIYSLVETAKVSSAKLLGCRLVARKLADGFTAHDVYRKQWSRLTTTADVQQALAVLEEYGWVQSIEHEATGAGRPTVRYVMNPRIWKDKA